MSANVAAVLAVPEAAGGAFLTGAGSLSLALALVLDNHRTYLCPPVP